VGGGGGAASPDSGANGPLTLALSPQGRGDEEKVILDKFSYKIVRGDRIGILGQNGSGKTSFIRLLVGELEPDAGKVKLAREIEFSYFDQKRKDLIPEWSLWRTLAPGGGDYIDVMGKVRHVCGYLADFLFDPKDALNAVKTLSGGQKNRLMLARILANPGPLLILDEPTNDLDMETLDMLEDILSNYTGTLIVVSHDRDFLDQTVSKILAFEGGGKVREHIGGYSDYIAAQGQDALKGPEIGQRATPSGKKDAPKEDAPKQAAKLSYKLQYELDNLPKRIAELELEIVALEKGLADPELYTRDAKEFNRLSARLELAKKELDHAEVRWLELEDLRDQAQAS
jgi:ATP-binding cassette subfamily F protein uup